MEIPDAHKHLPHVFIGEFFGTMMLTFAVCAQSVFTFGIFGIGMTLFGSILLFGNITGGNFNPAVTLGVLLMDFGKLGKNMLCLIISTCAQFFGALTGMIMASSSLISYTVKDGVDKKYSIAILQPTTDSDMAAFASEVACSFFFILIILMVKEPLTAPSKEGYLCCWTVGITLISCICLCASHTGAALNPAVGLAVNIYDGWQLNSSEYYKYVWIYTAGPYVGGMCAGFFHHYHKWSTAAVMAKKAELLAIEEAHLNAREGDKVIDY